MTLQARNPLQLLYRLSRIVFLGLVLYLGWILVVVQPDLAKRLMLPAGQTLAQRYGQQREQVESLLRSAIGAQTFGLNTLLLAQWDGGASLEVLAAEGRTPQLPLQPGQQALWDDRSLDSFWSACEKAGVPVGLMPSGPTMASFARIARRSFGSSFTHGASL